jgi:cytochrome o ubiquinol oxidase subunit IV
MSLAESGTELHRTDIAPGEQRLAREEIAKAIKSYLIGFGLAVLLTITSFFISGTTLVWEPSIPVALVVLAIAQMGVHLAFFFHITTGPDSVNNVLALAFGVLIVFLVLLGSLWIMANLHNNLAPMEEPMKTELARVPEVPAVTAMGVVRPAAIAPVGARVSGAIQALECEVNMQVKAGQLCAKIDLRPYQTAVDQSTADLQAGEAQLEKDKADLAKAKAAFESRSGAAKRGASSRKEIDRLRKSFESAQAQTNRDESKIAELQAALHAAETNLGHTDIVSPVDGVVLARNVELGQTVAANSDAPPLFVIAADLSFVHIEATLGADDSRKVTPGGKVSFTVEAIPNHLFVGTVTQIRPSQQNNEQAATTNVVITAPNPDLLLKPGMPAKIRMMTE